MHKNRVWCVVNVEDAGMLARMLAERVFALCSGFRHAGYLYLNGGAQEYAVIRESTGRQVESITFSWCTPERALELIRDVSAGRFDGEGWDSGVDLVSQVQAPERHGCCLLCA